MLLNWLWLPIVDPFLLAVQLFSDQVNFDERTVLDFGSLFVSGAIPDVIKIVLVIFIADLTVSVLLVWNWLQKISIVPRLSVVIGLDCPHLLLGVLFLSELLNHGEVLLCVVSLSLGDDAAVAIWGVSLELVRVVVRSQPILLGHSDQISVELPIKVTGWRCLWIFLILPELVGSSHLQHALIAFGWAHSNFARCPSQIVANLRKVESVILVEDLSSRNVQKLCSHCLFVFLAAEL